MNNRKRRYTLRIVALLMAAPVVVFTALLTLLYLPPVQHWAVERVTQVASAATGMNIHIGRIRLAFPLDLAIREVVVADEMYTDTLASIGELRTRVALWPLLRGQVEVEGISLSRIQAQTGTLIPAVGIDGQIAELRLSKGNIDLANQQVEVGALLMHEAKVAISLRQEEETPPDSTSPPAPWKIRLKRGELADVNLQLQMPADTQALSASWTQLHTREAVIDLHTQAYSVNHLTLADGAFSFDNGRHHPTPSFDPDHMAVSQIDLKVDSLYYKGQEIRGIVHQLALWERSGFQLTHTEGEVRMDSTGLHIPLWRMQTPHSHLQAVGEIPWSSLKETGRASMKAQVEGYLAMADIQALMPVNDTLSQPQWTAPLTFQVALHGNMRRLQIDTLGVRMDSVAHLAANGEVCYPANDDRRMAKASLHAQVLHNNLQELWTGADSSALHIPAGSRLDATIGADKTCYTATLSLHERKEGELIARGFYDTHSQEYALNARADSLPLHHFLPLSPLGNLTAQAHLAGQGTDPFASTTRLTARADIDSLLYAGKTIAGVKLNASMKEHRAQVTLESLNPLLDMMAEANAHIVPDSLSATAMVDVRRADLYALQMAQVPLTASVRMEMRGESNLTDSHTTRGAITDMTLLTPQGDFKPKNLYVKALTRPDTLYAQVQAGDLSLQAKGGNGLSALLELADKLGTEIASQAELLATRSPLNLDGIKHQLPTLSLTLQAQKDNPLTNYLQYATNIGLGQVDVRMEMSPTSGIQGEAFAYRLRTDSLELDTVRLTIATNRVPSAEMPADELSTEEPSTHVAIGLSVSNAPNKRKPAFLAQVDGLLENDGGHVELNFYNDKREPGLKLGAQGRLEESGGVRVSFFPEHPIIGFRPFSLNDSNYIALSDSGRIMANVTILDKAGTGLRLYSSPNDEALQDLTADLTRLNLSEILKALPYAPDVAGILNTEWHYVKSSASNTFSGTLQVDSLAYDGYALGTLGMEAAYLPTSAGKHLVNLQLLRNGEEIATADGQYTSPPTTGNGEAADGHLEAQLSLFRLPLEMANAFVPRDMVTLNGLLEGELTMEGSLSAPRINGGVRFDSVRLHSPLYAIDLHTDQAPVNIKDNHLTFDQFPLYAKGKNPFTLTGEVDLGNFSHMRADLQMRAVEYELLNARKNKQSVLHGKVFVSLSSTIQGELTNPVVRGRMKVLGNTDVTYVLKESPLTVEDRLGSMVTFVNFNDTLATAMPREEIALGGVDLMLEVQIDEGAQVQVDLGSDNYVEVQGGGNLTLQYTPQGDLLLTGRYTLTNGQMKYSLPVIPLKTFHIARGSFVEFTGDPFNPKLDITATERVRTSVTEENNSRYVNFDVGVSITNNLDNMGVAFKLDAPEDVSVQNQLTAMSDEERGKLAVTMLVTGMYAGGQGGTSNGFSTSNALNSFLQSEITNIAGSALKTVDVSIGVEDNYAADGTSQGGTDYSFRFAKRFWNNRLSVIIGGRISTGNEAVAEEEGSSFIDDISLEWRLDDSGTRYVKLFHTRNYESILEGEIVETGVGLVLRRKVNRLGELFIFRRKE